MLSRSAVGTSGHGAALPGTTGRKEPECQFPGTRPTSGSRLPSSAALVRSWRWDVKSTEANARGIRLPARSRIRPPGFRTLQTTVLSHGGFWPRKKAVRSSLRKTRKKKDINGEQNRLEAVPTSAKRKVSVRRSSGSSSLGVAASTGPL